MKKTLATGLLIVVMGLWCVAQTSTNGQGDGLQITHGPVVETVSDTTAQIAWSTNASSGTLLRYGTDPNHLDQKAGMPWGAITHRVELKNLKPGVTYYAQAVSDQGKGSGATIESQQISFQTREARMSTASVAAPSTPPVTLMAGPIPQLVKDTSAQIWWLPSSIDPAAKLIYGSNPANMNVRVPATPESNGSGSEVAQLSNLQPDTTYSYQILGQNGAVIASGQFKTEAANYAANKNLWITKGPVLEMIGSNSVVVAWSTNMRSGSAVHYGTDPNVLNQTASASWGQETHRVTINNLKANTKYYFQVESTPAQGTNTQAQSQPAPFQTVPEGHAAIRNIQPK